ncbi:MAG: phenylalanine--tRNA ligase beta subunit-related protein [Acidobacteriota bacterium]
MNKPPFSVSKELDGWLLFWAYLEWNRSPGDWGKRLRQAETEVQGRLDLERLSSYPPVAEMRKLFRAAGTDPTRYRPASEALLRRVLKGDALPSIHPLVDLNNCLSLRIACPCCVMAEGSFAPPLIFRGGRPGEIYESLKGPFRLEDKPLLVDTLGPLDAPITGNVRVKIEENTTAAWLVSYLPGQAVELEQAGFALTDLADPASGIRVSRISGC